MNRRNYIDVHHLTEGCKHDPYSVEVISFTDIEGYTTTLRIGSLSGNRLYAHSEPLEPFAIGDEALVLWELITGLTIARAMKIYERHFYFEDPMGSPSSYM